MLTEGSKVFFSLPLLFTDVIELFALNRDLSRLCTFTHEQVFFQVDIGAV